MTPAELLDAIDYADHVSRRGRRTVILQVRSPVILGRRGRLIGNDEGGPVFGFTRRQALGIRDEILAAARADAGEE